MDLGVTLAASSRESDVHTVYSVGVFVLAATDFDGVFFWADEAGMEVQLVALQAQHRFTGGQESWSD